MKRVPLVDVSALLSGTLAARREVGQQLCEAATDVGLLYISGHGVPQGLSDEAREEARRFFALPQATKEAMSIRQSNSARGYQQVFENVTQGSPDAHEAIDLYRDVQPPHDHAATSTDGSTPPTNFGFNQWPDPAVLPRFRPLFEQEYVHAMLALGDRVMRGIALGLDRDEHYFEPYFKDAFWGMRIIRYPPGPPKARSDAMGCGEHCDYGCLTILNQDPRHTDSLEAQTRDGQWIKVAPIDGTFAINIGDMLAHWTGGRFRATPHRVVSPTNGLERVSVPFFYEPAYHAVIQPIPGLTGGDGNDHTTVVVRADGQSVMYGDHLLSKTSSNFVFNQRS